MVIQYFTYGTYMYLNHPAKRKILDNPLDLKNSKLGVIAQL